MIPTVGDHSADGTQHDGTQHDGTQHVPDGPAPTDTQFVPDGPARGAHSPLETQYVPDLPRFGRFRALAELGAGAMGTVYRAHDDVLGRPVAIKALHARDRATRERFLREARAIGAVLHPNILAVYDAGSDDDTPYLVMELAAGGSLEERIKAGPLPIETVRELGIQIARALAAAHAAGILHRDVKPANILLAGNGAWKLADFGIARLPDSTLTAEGQFLGSPAYAAPESLGAGRFSPASDVYGLGATLYEALAGVPPHGDHDLRALVRKLDHDPPPLATRRAVPASLERAVMAALARDPARRPSADELARLLAITEVETRPAPPGPSPRTKALALALAAVAVALVIVAVSHDRRGGAPSLESVAGSPARPVPHETPRRTDEPAARADEPAARIDEPAGRADDPAAPIEPSWRGPQIVDQDGNPVDDETARRILEQMERDARSEYEGIGRRRGHHK